MSGLLVLTPGADTTAAQAGLDRIAMAGPSTACRRPFWPSGNG
ncbi:MAG: hypothetical protein ACRD1K_00945 [Acidimicrobiales bacterium]